MFRLYRTSNSRSMRSTWTFHRAPRLRDWQQLPSTESKIPAHICEIDFHPIQLSNKLSSPTKANNGMINTYLKDYIQQIQASNPIQDNVHIWVIIEDQRPRLSQLQLDYLEQPYFHLVRRQGLEVDLGSGKVPGVKAVPAVLCRSR